MLGVKEVPTKAAQADGYSKVFLQAALVLIPMLITALIAYGAFRAEVDYLKAAQAENKVIINDLRIQVATLQVQNAIQNNKLDNSLMRLERIEQKIQ